MTYFHIRMYTIIGAKSFHCPVRDGKEWDQLAMVVRQSGIRDQVSGISPGTCLTHSEEVRGF